MLHWSYITSTRVFATKTLLEDDSPPAVTAVDGALRNDAPHSATERATFDARDTGTGLYRVVTQVRVRQSGDWITLTRRILDQNLGKCTDAGQDPNDEYEFTSPTPCKMALDDVAIDLDTTQVPDGTHRLRVYVEDAGGNRADVIADKPFVVSNTPPAAARAPVPGPAPAPAPNGGPGPPEVLAPTNGTRASNNAFIRLAGATRRVVAFGQVITLRGHLVDENDEPIRAAVLDLQRRSLVPKSGLVGPSWTGLGTATTGSDGSFRSVVPAGASQALRITYRANQAQVGVTDAAELQVITRAKATVGVARTRLRNGQTAVLTGTVAGPLPRAGVIVSLQAFVPRQGWVPVATTQRIVRTTSSGRFRLAYRFQRTLRTTAYRFRVLVNEDSGFEYGQGVSRMVKVTVRP